MEAYFAGRTPAQIQEALALLGRQVPAASAAAAALSQRIAREPVSQVKLPELALPEIELAFTGGRLREARVFEEVKNTLQQIAVWLDTQPWSGTSDLRASFDAVLDARTEPALIKALRAFRMSLSINSDTADFERAKQMIASLIELVSGGTFTAVKAARPKIAKPSVPFTLAVDAPAPERLARATWTRIELEQDDGRDKSVCLTAGKERLHVTWRRAGDAVYLMPTAVLESAGKIELDPALESMIVQATLSLGSISRVFWDRHDKIYKVELAEGGIAYLRKPVSASFFGVDLTTGPRRDHALWLLVQASHQTVASPNVLLPDGTSIAAEVDGFRDLFSLTTVERAHLDPNAVLLWCFVAHHLDPNVANLGVDSNDHTVMIDGETAFLPGLSDRGLEVLQRAARNLMADGMQVHVPPPLAERWKSWTLDDVRRILAPAGLSDEEVAAVHQRIRIVVEAIDPRSGAVLLARCMKRARGELP